MGQKYRIHVGQKMEDNAFTGKLDPKNNAVVLSDLKPVSVRKGKVIIANIAMIWARRLDRDGKPPAKNETIHINDPRYGGIIEPLKWGTPGGIMIKCRYVPGYDTIDRDYQDNILQVGIREGFLDGGMGESVDTIELMQGDQEFDYDLEPAKILMLKVTHYNSKSAYCNPEANGGDVFSEVTDEEIKQSGTKEVDQKYECLMLIHEAENDPQSIRNLFEIVRGTEFNQVTNTEDANELYKVLKLFADQKPDVFHNGINRWKTNTSNVIEKAKSFKVFDLTKDGVVLAGNGKEIIFENVPAKGEKMLDWAFGHYLKKEVFQGFNKLKKITDKLT